MAWLPARGCRLWLRTPAKGRQVTARVAYKGNRQQARPPAGMAGASRGGSCGRRQHLRPSHKGRLPAATSQGEVDYGFDARRKAAYGQGHRPQGRPQAGAAPKQ
ncbi:hypothetical protein B296_00048304, partial [Ensete ventricosum]